MSYRIIIWLTGFALISCDQPKSIHIPSPQKATVQISSRHLTPEEEKDKILGAIVGSAIGDAMGASTEMWSRDQILQEYGYINDLTPAIRAQSPEGTWEHNLVAGATTDDTRWKYFIGQYLVRNRSEYSPVKLATFIQAYYEEVVQDLSEGSLLKSTDELDAQIEKIDWIKEWARVSEAFIEGEKEYRASQARFYGGEMSCAGLLYSPVFGLVASGPEEAYVTAYDHALFDIGYAKDISAMSATMTYLAMYGQDFTSVIDSSFLTDPYGFKDSRLVGRILQSSVDEINQIIEASLDLTISDTSVVENPLGYPGTDLDWIRQEYIYQALEKRQKAIAFHAGEIWDITYASLLYGDGDFRKTMAFIVNYGRDNDTVAAIAGTILGAYLGYEALPEDLKSETVRVNREIMGIDLEALSEELSGVLTN